MALTADGIPIVLRACRRDFEQGPFKLGSLQLPSNFLAASWVVISAVSSCHVFCPFTPWSAKPPYYDLLFSAICLGSSLHACSTQEAVPALKLKVSCCEQHAPGKACKMLTPYQEFKAV